MSAVGLSVLLALGCAPAPDEVLAAFVYEAERAGSRVSAMEVAVLGQTSAAETGLCAGPTDGGNRENTTAVTLEFGAVDSGAGFPLPDVASQTWTYTQWECFTDGVRTDGTVVVDITRAADGTWTLAYSGGMWIADEDTCSLSATGTADAAGVLVGPLQGTFCEEPLESFGVELMVPAFAL